MNTEERDQLDAAILATLAPNRFNAFTPTEVARRIFKGHGGTGQYASIEDKRNYDRVRRRLHALCKAGKVGKGLRRGSYVTLDPRRIAAERRGREEQDAQTARVYAAAEALGFLRGDEHLNRRSFGGSTVELTCEQFLALARKAGVGVKQA